MILIYAYINKFKNYTTQEIIFDPRWQINFSNKKLSIQYRGQSSASAVIRGDRKPDNRKGQTTRLSLKPFLVYT